MRPLRRIALAIPIVAALAMPAHASDPWVPIFNPERIYVHCNADKATVAEHVTYQWNTTAPTTSFTANGGCGSLDTDKTSGDGVTWTGTHLGNLDKLTVHAWVIDTGPVRVGVYPEIYADVSITIDERAVVGGVEAHLTPIPSSTGLSRLLEFSVTKINMLSEADYKQHTVTINMETSAYLDGDQIAWVLDASEVQSGVSFSPTTLATTRIVADG